jgi:O-6-methylguanine DNA methyltransferase
MQTIMKHAVAAAACRLPISTPEGEFVARYSSQGLCGLEFPADGQRKEKAQPVRPPAQIRRWHAATDKALRRVLRGQSPTRLPPLDLSAGTDFQREVWRALQKIGWGRTQSYAQIAHAIGNPRAVRAVGGACGANPIPVFVPCHRVLAANHGLGGFSGGLAWKRRLLSSEGSKVAKAG